MKKIPKELWTGYNACRKWGGNLEKAEVYYKKKGINLKDNFYDGWNMYLETRS